MNIQLYNTLTNQQEAFKPIHPDKVTLYSCGPTVYDFAHIGNFRTFLFGDLLRRFFELAGYHVDHVTNITDVGHMTEDDGSGEDRMTVGGLRIKEAKKSGTMADESVANPDDPFQVAKYFMDAFLEDGKRLGYKVAFEYPDRVPRATDNIDGMISMIQTLIEREHAYVADDGVVYFSVESFPAYGQLSGNSIGDLRTGASERIFAEDQAMKRHPADFMLWKPDLKHKMKWDSPWGTGYPGWHIECSVMASKYLGQNVIDIHTGGEDLIFPHHECEVAQSCGASGESSFANYWIHARFLMVEGAKMSKSAGTFYTVRDILTGNFKKDTATGELWGREVDPSVLRFELLKSHYRTNLNFTAKSLADSAINVRRLQEFRQSLEARTDAAEDVDLTHPIVSKFAAALADDLNISGALATVIPWAATKPDNAAEALGALKLINSVLSVAPLNEGFDFGNASAGGDRLAQAEQWCTELDQARNDKNYSLADEIREKIRAAGFEVRTTKDGTVIQKELV